MSETRRVALVTGSARRVGAAIVRGLHAAGMDVAIHHRDSAAEAGRLAAELERERPGSTLVLQAELAHFDRLPELVAQVVGRFGRLDALVNNASTFFPTPLGEATPAQWDALFGVNARGAIVNLADIHGERPLRDHAVYGMGKAALLHLTRALALDLAPEVRVNAVAPGAILWPDAGKPEAAKSAVLARTPLGRTGTLEEVAEAVRWLLADATYTTGQVLRLDGGRMLQD